MPKFLNTLGNSTLGVGLCGRCSKKFPLGELHPDRNTPGLMVCDKDNDEFDPYRLPALQDDRLILPFTRPDVPLDGTNDPINVLLAFLVTQDFEYFITEDDDYLIPSP